MNLNVFDLTRLLITIFILCTINLFGLTNFSNDRLFFILNTYDLLLLMINFWFILVFIKNDKLRFVVRESLLKYVFYFYLIVILVFFSMPFRGPTSVLDAVRVGRHYLILPVAFFIYYDVLFLKKSRYYLNLFKFIAVISAAQMIVNAFSPQIINNIFHSIGRAEEGFKQDYQRNVLLSPSMIFPHILTIFYFHKLIFCKFQKKTFFLFIFLLIGSSLQGFRVYFIILLFNLLLVLIIFGSFKKAYKWIAVLIIVMPLTIYLDSKILNNQIYGKIYTAYEEVMQGTGSYQGRIEIVKIRQIPLLFEKPFFGWGFIYYNSDYGRSLGLRPSGEDAQKYGLYSIDSGYITILMQFGFIGVSIILLFYGKMIIRLFLEKKNNPTIYATMISTVSLLIFSLYTHGAFFREFGLLPFVIMLGLTAEKSIICSD